MKYKVILILLAFILNSCASVPQQSVELSEEISRMIMSARKSHLDLLDAYTALRVEQTEKFLEDEWIPSFTARFVNESNVLSYIEIAETPEKKGAEILEFAQAALPLISDRRNSMIAVITGVDRIVRNKVESHYQDILNVNHALTAHLASASNVGEIRAQLQRQLNINIENLIPLDEMNNTMEKLLKAGVEAEKIPELLKEFKEKIK